MAPSRPRARRLVAPLLAATLAGTLGPACKGSMEEKLREVLVQVVDEVSIGESEVVARCKNGEEVKVPTSELELNLFGMAEPERLGIVAKALSSSCEAQARGKVQEESDTKRFAEECAKKKIKCEGDVEAMRTALCAKLSSDLPLRGEKRDEYIASNARNWGCPDPGPPQIGATGWWEVEEEGKGKKASITLKLASEEAKDGSSSRLTVRCEGGKPSLYIAGDTKLAKTKKVDAKVDGKKQSWKAAMSTDKTAVFVKDIKPAVAAMSKGKTLLVTFKDARKKTVQRTFDIQGFAAASKGLRKACKL